MYEFEIPTDIASLTGDVLTECIAEAKREFGLLAESDDLSDDVLDRMTELADGLEAMYDENRTRADIGVALSARSTVANRLKRITFASKLGYTETEKVYPASDFAYVPDPAVSSSWQLRLTASPGGDPDPQVVDFALATLEETQTEIPADAIAAIKAKVRAAWKHLHDGEAVPAVIANADDAEELSEDEDYE